MKLGLWEAVQNLRLLSFEYFVLSWFKCKSVVLDIFILLKHNHGLRLDLGCNWWHCYVKVVWELKGDFLVTCNCELSTFPLKMDDADSSRPFFYCGTSTGDVLAINMTTKLFQSQTPAKMNFARGVTALAHLKNNNFLVGTGCGEVCELKFPSPGDVSKTGNKTAAPKAKVVR